MVAFIQNNVTFCSDSINFCIQCRKKPAWKAAGQRQHFPTLSLTTRSDCLFTFSLFVHTGMCDVCASSSRFNMLIMCRAAGQVRLGFSLSCFTGWKPLFSRLSTSFALLLALFSLICAVSRSEKIKLKFSVCFYTFLLWAALLHGSVRRWRCAENR